MARCAALVLGIVLSTALCPGCVTIGTFASMELGSASKKAGPRPGATPTVKGARAGLVLGVAIPFDFARSKIATLRPSNDHEARATQVAMPSVDTASSRAPKTSILPQLPRFLRVARAPTSSARFLGASPM